jgi:cytochrome c oxidase subunit 3
VARDATTHEGGGPSGGHGHDPHLAHHFDTPGQQFTAGKLGMWLFLATEILLFSGLFCAYAVYRQNHQDVFQWGSHFLDVPLGGTNTLVLITSSLTMAWAVRCAQLGRRKRLILFLSLTLVGGITFLCIKYVEYKPKFEHGLLWGNRYHPDESYVMAHFHLGGEHGEEAREGTGEEPSGEAPAGDPEHGREVFQGTCSSCHGPDARGLPNQGQNLVQSEFVEKKTNEELVAFVMKGRQPWDPDSKLGIAMPARGGNPILHEEDIRDAIAYLRILVAEGREADSVSAQVAEAAPGAGAEAAPPRQQAAAFSFPKSVLPLAMNGPPGLAERVTAVAVRGRHAVSPHPPLNGHQFFGIYFLLTGLHGIHVVAGMIVIAWLLVGAIRGRFGEQYFTPVDLGGLYWHLVDLIWIFLFPLLYLI